MGDAPNQAHDGDESLSFEETMDRLDRVVTELERGDLSLEEALARFEEGIRLARLGTQRLERAERRVEALLGGEEGPARTVPIASDAEPSPTEEIA